VRGACASDFRRSRARAKTRVAACVTGVRQSRDCRHPLPLRRPHVFTRPFRFFPEIGRASRRALGCRSGRLAPAPAESADRRGARGGRLRRGCGAMLSSRAAPHPHPPRHASPGGFLRLASSRLPLLRPRSSAHLRQNLGCGGASTGIKPPPRVPRRLSPPSQLSPPAPPPSIFGPLAFRCIMCSPLLFILLLVLSSYSSSTTANQPRLHYAPHQKPETRN
jgi:hypothetical protein